MLSKRMKPHHRMPFRAYNPGLDASHADETNADHQDSTTIDSLRFSVWKKLWVTTMDTYFSTRGGYNLPTTQEETHDQLTTSDDDGQYGASPDELTIGWDPSNERGKEDVLAAEQRAITSQL